MMVQGFGCVCRLACVPGTVWLSVRRLCGVVGVWVQVALMDVVPSAVAALDAHRGIKEVAECGLILLQYLACASDNKVTP
jgi:hypothetical protein